MNKKKIALFAGVALAACAALTSCTKSFCTVVDKASVLYTAEGANVETNTYPEYGKGTKTVEVEASATTKGYLIPTDTFNAFIEEKVATEAQRLLDNVYNDTTKYDPTMYNMTYARSIALFAGPSSLDSINDLSTYTLWANFDRWVAEAMEDSSVGIANCPDTDYITLYKSTFNALVSSKTTCISPNTEIYNGSLIEGTSWGQAFSNFGLIEGLLVYPIAWLLYTMSKAFIPVMGSFGALLAVFLVTLIVRGILILATFKQTLSQQKMTSLQPELAKIQAKYPNANTNTYEKQKLGQEQMALYKKNKINPFGMFIVLIIQFPIFIAVWSAMQGSSILMEGDIFGLALSTTTSTGLTTFNGVPCVMAWIVFVLMAAAQFFSMKIPQWKQKKAQKEAVKLSKNPAQDQQNKTMSIVNNVMVVMIIVMGLSLPIAMAIYWFFSALISLGQSLITQKIASSQKLKAKNAKK